MRLFWPLAANVDNPRAHPLWTFDQLAMRFPTEQLAREHLRSELARRILEASTFVSDDPAFDEFAITRERAIADRARAAVAGSGDLSQLVDMVQEENAGLRRTTDTQRRELDELRQQVEQLTLALRAMPDSRVDDARDTAPPETVIDAVTRARTELASKVEIARETDADIAELNETAGPPDKILRYLRGLAALSDALAAGPLGLSVPIWLERHGARCSGDSESAKGNADARKFRTRSINGVITDCEFHAKPAEGTSPDMCARIYFAISAVAPYVRVGYIGRHSD